MLLIRQPVYSADCPDYLIKGGGAKYVFFGMTWHRMQGCHDIFGILSWNGNRFKNKKKEKYSFMGMENIQHLLTQVNLLIKKNDELLDATGARFNMFKVCRVNHYENTHSAIITEFLKPNGSHGMGSLFLEAFLKVLKTDVLKVLETDDNSLDDDFKINTKACKVNTEVSTDYGRMDILITDGAYAICIENKVYAVDQYEQLQRYAKHLEETYKENHWKIYYLTLDGRNSGENVKYTTIAYSEGIVNWLEECIKIAVEKPMLRETLCQYRNHIKNLTGTNMEKKYMDELIKLIGRSAENYSSAKQIAGIFGQVKKAIFEKFLKKLEEFVQQGLNDDKEIKFYNTASEQKLSGFGFLNTSWKFSIDFEFQASNYRGLIFGIGIDKDFQDKIAHIASKFKHEEFHNEFEAGFWTLDKDVQELLWVDDIWEKIMNAEKNKELLDRYKSELEKVFPFVQKCIDFQNLSEIST